VIHVAVSILNYNSSESTIACVQSLLAASRETGDSYDLDIFVADNDSAIDDQRQLQLSLAELAEVHLQVNSTNRGFAAGHNNNLESIFLHSRPEYIWILNNDCLVFKDTLVSLIECAGQNPNVGIWGATLLEQDGETIQCAGGCFYNSWISSYRQYGRGTSLVQIDQLGVVDFDYIAGASLFFPVTRLQDGFHPLPELSTNANTLNQRWLNESFFLYFEELDLAKRLKPGVAMAWCRGALIRHAGGASTGAGGDQRTSSAEYHATLSALKFTQMYYPNRLWVMAPIRYLSKCVQLLINGKLQLLAPITRAYGKFWRR
jgi:GT2 family glycosyltransferase